MVKKKQKQKKSRRPLSPKEVLITQKAKAFLKAIKAYWKRRDEITAKQLPAFASALDIEQDCITPLNLSSIIWALRDGAALIRYKKITTKPQYNFRILDITMEEWGNNYLLIPTPKGDLSLA